MVGLFANIGQSIGYSARNTFLRPLFWLGLILTAFITGACIVGGLFLLAAGMWYLAIPLWIVAILLIFFFCGLQVQIFAGKDLTFKGFFGSIGRGFQLCVIDLIYTIIIDIFFAICVALGVFGVNQITAEDLTSMISSGTTSLDAMSGVSPTLFPNGVTAVGVIMLIVFILIALFLFILMLAACVNFARAGKFGAAFNFGDIFKRIGVLGVLKFIVAIILFIIIMVILAILVGLIAGLLGLIPFAGIVLMVIFLLLVIPFMFVFGVKYFSNLFAD